MSNDRHALGGRYAVKRYGHLYEQPTLDGQIVAQLTAKNVVILVTIQEYGKLKLKLRFES